MTNPELGLNCVYVCEVGVRVGEMVVEDEVDKVMVVEEEGGGGRKGGGTRRRERLAI